MSAFSDILEGYANAQVRLREERAQQINTDWRAIEQALVTYFESRHIQIVEISGAPTINIVRHFEAEEAVTAHLSLEQLARYLVAEFER